MKLAYEAANTIEGHMVLNMLEQSGLSARIDGEFLQGGMGELPVAGLVRVMVDEADYDNARLLIKQWEELEAEPQTPIDRKNFSLGSTVVAFVAGVAVAAIYYNTPVTEDGIDYNGDGQLDETYTYVNYLLSEVSQDRNFDGNIDALYSYDSRGLIESSVHDDNFDGTFETQLMYEKGNVYRAMSDTNGDGSIDYREDYVFGVISKAAFLNPESGKPTKTKHFNALGLEYSLIDTTGDGVMDARHDYDSREEIAGRSLK